MEDPNTRQIRAAENQSVFRAVNEETEQLNRIFADFTPFGSWACECATTDCFERIDMTLAEYEEVRSAPTRFAVFPSDDHVLADVERVVARNERYWTVEKVGAGASRAAELADRHGPTRSSSA